MATRPVPTLAPPAEPARCALQHRGFSALGEFEFRRSPADRTPMLMLRFGNSEAGVPLRSLQLELGIDDDSSDGRMLLRVAEALEYVPIVRPGDLLPAEVRTGEASWLPAPRHRAIATARLHARLLAWLAQTTGEPGSLALDPSGLEGDSALRAAVQRAFAHAATALGLPGGTVVMTLLQQMADEMAYIESLRETLLGRLLALQQRLEGLTLQLGPASRPDAHRLDALAQVQRLLRPALRQIGGRFADVDVQTREVMFTLAHIDAQRGFVRSNRDWLYRCQCGWDALLDDWASVPELPNEALWALIARSYRFLARHYMPVQEWRPGGERRAARNARQPPPSLRNW